MIIRRSEAQTCALIVSERLGCPLPHPESLARKLAGLPDPRDPERVMGPAEAARVLPLDVLRAIMDTGGEDDAGEDE